MPIVLTPPSSMAKESVRNIYQGTKSSGSADEEDYLEGLSNISLASMSTLAPSDESKSVWPPLLQKLTGRSASGGRSSSPAFRPFVPSETLTRARSRGHAIFGGHRSLSPTSMRTRRQTTSHLSSRGPSGIKRKQEVTVYSYYDEEHMPIAAGSARREQETEE